MTSAMDKRWTTNEEVLETFGQDIAESSTEAIEHRARLIDNEVRIFKNEKIRLQNEEVTMKEKIKENTEKIKLNKQLPYLVSNVVEVGINNIQ
jgi:26S proteasome regulatory subunit T5